VSYHRDPLAGFSDLPAKAPSGADVVSATIGIPGFNLEVPIASKERLYLAIGFSILVGIAGGTVLAQYLKKAQQ
jgi:hypothetical protein